MSEVLYLYYGNQNHVPIINCMAEKTAPFIIGCTAQEQRLLSEIWKAVSDKIYYEELKRNYGLKQEIGMNNDKEEQILKKRILDLARAADNKGICTYTDFLNLNEASIFFLMKNDIPNVNYDLFGGYTGAERKVLCFYGDESVKAFSDYITCIRILPLNKKFSDDLSHRDFLGSLMNLGIDRSKIGDILVREKEGFVFCETSISQFIIDNLDKVKHTNIKCGIMDKDAPDIQPKFKEIRGSVSSARLDSIIALAFNSSRNSILGLISGGKVFVDGKLMEASSYMLKEDETVSVRGFGKFIYKGMENQTKKGRYFVVLLKYI